MGKLKAILGGNINFSNERYVLNWARKSDAFKSLQIPTTKTLIRCPEESLKKDRALILMLEKATQEIIDAVIALERLSKGNDQLKTNTALKNEGCED